MMLKRAMAVCFLALCAGAFAQPTQPATIKWTGTDTQGNALTVPQQDRPSLLLFVRGDQPQSKQAVRLAKEAAKSVAPLQAMIILSSPQDITSPAKVAESLEWTGSMVLDPGYVASGAMGIHVWPTALVVDKTGAQVAHLGGISGSYSKELDAYLAFAGGKIDAAALKQRLGVSDVVGDTPEQVAARHLSVALRLMEKGQFGEAQKEISEGLKRQPTSGPLQLAMARVLIRRGEAGEAAKLVERMEAGAVPAWQRNLIRAKVHIALEQWDAALPLLQEALKLNPDPAEAQYELGRVYAKKGDAQRAADAFRAAFEATPAGRAVAAPAK
jgi:tetratricopeptide (TPR) repeat protein